MRINRVLGLTGLAVMLPALAAAQDTTYDYDRSAPFAQYRTYAFKQGTSSGDQLIDARIISAIETQLNFKGLRKVNASPDVIVDFNMAYRT
jgi:hypothetical protein